MSSLSNKKLGSRIEVRAEKKRVSLKRRPSKVFMTGGGEVHKTSLRLMCPHLDIDHHSTVL
ncbi:hypothetical protein QR98_0051700 [Sarcoptes scabiei]|uniref:Uncharacterized protein n=1 Tax=Sarcoptes scabiei TaxID=52283 RepID=A0A132A6V8_SARSC|nr:hypothetical protein QR98_0051700 [Sarcoptes scabiei]